MPGKVYIILVNYTKYQDTIECLESIFKSSYKNLQVLVVDNSPDEISVINFKKWLNNQYKDVFTLYEHLIYPLNNSPIPYVCINETEIENKIGFYKQPVVLIKATNNGFAAANNIALKYFLKNADDASFAWVLNNDTIVDKQAIEKLVEFYDTNANGAYFVTSKLLSYYNKNKIQAIIGSYNKWTGGSYHIGEGEEDRGQYDNYQITDTNYLVGASMFMQKKFIEQVGLMNEDYFLYFEDLDWSRQAVKAGFKLALQPSAKVYHKEGGTNIAVKGNKANKDMPGYYTLINRVKFTIKWYPLSLPTVYLGVGYGLLKRILQGKLSLVKRACFAIMHTDILVRYLP
jgi:GT2 family glycosyltransferase